VNTAACLAGYGLAVALIGPRWLHAAGTARAPRLGILAWLLAIGTAGGSLLAAAAAATRSGDLPLTLPAFAVVAAAAARLVWAGAVIWRQARTRSAAHCQLVGILGRPDPRLGAVLVEADERLVYCLPSPAPTVVVTTGARRALSPIQLQAALAHERAHLSGRHHLLLGAAYAVGRAVPWLPLFAQAGPALARLLEMRADDAAARRYGRRTVAAAIAAMGRQPAPAGALGVAGPSALARGLRLCTTEPAWQTRIGRLGLALTVLLLAAGPYLFSIAPFCPHPWH
jgi:Zn-dependent protease with chaperone function